MNRDVPRILITPTAISCGISQLYGMTNAPLDDVLFNIATYLYHPSRGQACAAFCYSNVEGDGYSTAFFRWVTDEGFGDVNIVDAIENPKTGHRIYHALWVVDHKVLREWWKKERIRRFVLGGE